MVLGWLSCCLSNDVHSRRARAASAFRSTTDRGASSLYFEDAYEYMELLGEGKTGKVFRVRAYQSPRFEAAAKVVPKSYLTTPQRRLAFVQELEVLKRVTHPSVLKLLDIFDDDEKFVIVTERVHGGDLLDVVCKTQERPLRECDVAFVIRELLTVVAYLHKLHITHRDIKIDNVMCRTNDVADGIVLIDFGLAHRDRNGEMSGMNGTVHYMAPEMFGRDSTYGQEIDVWAVGVVAYLLLFGRFPFDAKFMSQIEDKIAAGNYEFPPELVNQVSPQATKFIEYLLAVNPADRPPAAMALQHPWMQLDHVSTRPFTADHMGALHAFYSTTKKGQSSSSSGHASSAATHKGSSSNSHSHGNNHGNGYGHAPVNGHGPGEPHAAAGKSITRGRRSMSSGSYGGNNNRANGYRSMSVDR